MLKEAFERLEHGEPLTEEDAIQMLSIQNLSEEYYQLLDMAGRFSRKAYNGRGYIFAQIGLDVAPCRGNCLFCSLAQCNCGSIRPERKSLEEVLSIVDKIDFKRVTALFLMTTAEYDPEEFLRVGRAVRERIPAAIALVANTGDFDLNYALRLKEAGFTGAYHIVRLGEGVDTGLKPEARERTLDAIAQAGLRLYYCLEPLGPEHTYEEMVREMMRARRYHVEVMAAMRRVNVEGTPFQDNGVIDDFEYTKIVAVTRLVTMPRVSMNVHEPLTIAMLGGVNQLYAEIGVNPRDNNRQTEKNRGFSVDEVAAMLEAAGYTPCIEGA
ncbi:radical SAM protein [uncultured Pseudoflavonifractor sp.]|uniref:radical SAM protein n=1 Tax=uncultured Pseudoflavonifractor sp. TaxID=1221379 RepID=UPI0025EA44F0|nr:radical SAM protein [uncultured Pseudoflavonifractor sp.]